jgi:hypothetical protein
MEALLQIIRVAVEPGKKGDAKLLGLLRTMAGQAAPKSKTKSKSKSKSKSK